MSTAFVIFYIGLITTVLIGPVWFSRLGVTLVSMMFIAAIEIAELLVLMSLLPIVFRQVEQRNLYWVVPV